MMPLVLVTAILNAPVRPLLDSAVINLLPDPSKYGKIRLWGQCGFGLGSSSVGPLLTSDNFGYEAVFVVHVLLALPTLMMMHLALSAPAKPVRGSAKPNFFQGLRHVASNKDTLVFFGLVFVLGVSSGLIENFAYVRLREVGATGTVRRESAPPGRATLPARSVPFDASSPTLSFAGFGHVSVHFEPRRNADVLVLRRYREAAERHRRAHPQLVRVHHPIPHLRELVDVALVGAARGGPPRLHVRRDVGGGDVSRAQNSSARSDGDHGQCSRRCCCDSSLVCPCAVLTLLARAALGGGKQLSVLNGMYGGLGQSLGALIGGALQVKLGTSHTFYVAALGDAVLLVLTLGWWALNPRSTRRDDAA